MITNPIRFVKVKPNQPVNMTAIIMQGGRIVAVGYNSYNRLSYTWKRASGYHDDQGIHAERLTVSRAELEAVP